VNKREIARVLHESRMKLCYGDLNDKKQPWPKKLPGDYGYVTQPWIEIAWAQAEAVIKLLEKK
jgi:hypothetical protein